MPDPTEPEKPKFILGGEFKEPPPEFADIAGSNAEVRDELAREAEEQRARDIARKVELDDEKRRTGELKPGDPIEPRTASQYPEPGFISSEEYVDPGPEINAMFDESFAEMRERASRRREYGEQEDQETGGG